MNKIKQIFKNLMESIAESRRLQAEYMIRTTYGTYPLTDKDREEMLRH